MNALATPMLAGLGPSELLIIAGVLILLFGAAKLPELARGSGRALRIFKAETKGLMTDDEDDDTAGGSEQRRVPPPQDPPSRGGGSTGDEPGEDNDR